MNPLFLFELCVDCSPARPKNGKSLKMLSVSPAAVDSEGTSDVYKTTILKLKNRGTLDEPISESNSMDWRAESRHLQRYIMKLNTQNSFIPRAGELVLWTSHIDGELIYDEETDCYRAYSFNENRWLAIPQWRAGTVGQTPECNTVIEDLIGPTPKQWAVNYSGFRVETFPDPNNEDKSYSLHTKYVYLHCIRPLNYWQIFLHGIPLQDWHPSIKYALTVMSSITLLDKYRFKGTWPNAVVYCRGVFIGAELLLVGDTVRLKPRGYSLGQDVEVTDVLVIENIKLELSSCVDDIKSPLLAKKHSFRIQGKVYTTSHDRAYRGPGEARPRSLTHDQVVAAFQYVGMNGYGPWYASHSSNTVVDVSQDLILGRCYEPDAMKLIFDDTSLGLDLSGVVSGREYSRKADERIPLGKDWFWGDYRTQTLGLDSLNGEDVGRYSDARDPKMWRACLNVMDGKATPNDLRDAHLPRDSRRPSGASGQRSSFAEVRKTSKLVSRGLGVTDMSTNVTSTEETDNDPHGPHGPDGHDDSSDSDSSSSEDLGNNLRVIPPYDDSSGSEEFVPFPTGESRGTEEDHDSQPERQAKRPRYDK